jgi:hypothetical protein
LPQVRKEIGMVGGHPVLGLRAEVPGMLAGVFGSTSNGSLESFWRGVGRGYVGSPVSDLFDMVLSTMESNGAGKE